VAWFGISKVSLMLVSWFCQRHDRVTRRDDSKVALEVRVGFDSAMFEWHGVIVKLRVGPTSVMLA
jgi:hypothetical protein